MGGWMYDGWMYDGWMDWWVWGWPIQATGITFYGPALRVGRPTPPAPRLGESPLEKPTGLIHEQSHLTRT